MQAALAFAFIEASLARGVQSFNCFCMKLEFRVPCESPEGIWHLAKTFNIIALKCHMASKYVGPNEKPAPSRHPYMKDVHKAEIGFQLCGPVVVART